MLCLRIIFPNYQILLVRFLFIFIHQTKTCLHVKNYMSVPRQTHSGMPPFEIIQKIQSTTDVSKALMDDS